jgi:hypothetical protein
LFDDKLYEKENAMNDFIAKYQDQLTGVLSGYDRLVFRGTLWKDRLSGMKGYLWAHGLGAKDFGCHAEQVSKRMKEASLAPLLAAGREVRYLNSGKDNKQQIALEIAARDGIVEGPICALTAVELCSSHASTDGNGWRGRWIGPALPIGVTITASPGSNRSAKRRSYWMSS